MGLLPGEFWTIIIVWCFIYAILPTYLLVVGAWYLCNLVLQRSSATDGQGRTDAETWQVSVQEPSESSHLEGADGSIKANILQQ